MNKLKYDVPLYHRPILTSKKNAISARAMAGIMLLLIEIML